MDWKRIKVSTDGTQFTFGGKVLYNRKFKEVLKFHEPGLAPVKDKSGAYHIEFGGSELYAERYDRTFGYYCNRAAVVKNNDWFHLNESGQRAYVDSFSWVGNFQEDFCPARNMENKSFHINLNGQRTYSQNYIYTGDYKDGIACAKQEDDMTYHIDVNGHVLNGKPFVDLGLFHKNFATAKDEGGWHHINKSGAPLYSQRYHSIEPFYNGCARVETFDNEFHIINEIGRLVLEV